MTDRAAPGVGARLLALLVLAAAAVGLALWLRPPGLGVLSAEQAAQIFWTLRVPRVALAVAAGATLGLAGVLCQTLFRNPLATPDTLGISSMASLAAAVGILAGGRNPTHAFQPGTWLLAGCGALAATGAILLLSRLRGARDLTHLLLAGVCLSAVSSAGIVLATYLGDGTITNEIVRWLMGSLVSLKLRSAAVIGAVFVVSLAAGLWMRRELEALLLGDVVAASRGVAVGRVVVCVLVLIGVITATVVAQCGPIAFVSLIVPHLARGVVGTRLLPLMLGAPVLGAGLLALCDGLSRSMTVFEIPVGVVTSMVGAVFFFYLLLTRADEN